MDIVEMARIGREVLRVAKRCAPAMYQSYIVGLGYMPFFVE
jgi:hypothetical protein